MDWLKNAWSSARAVLCPSECVWCECPTDEGVYFCDECLPLFVNDYYRCQRCASPLPPVVPNRRCSRCTQAKWRFSSVITLGPYRGRLREAVILMKKKRFELLRRAIGLQMAEALQKSLSPDAPTRERGTTFEPPLLIPVPNHWTRNLTRSVCPASSLANSIAIGTGWTVLNRVIYRSRKTDKQGMLSWTDRKSNVRGAFKLKSSVNIKVLTSGATANEMTKLLVSAGALRVSIAVAARGTGAREVIIKPR
jgi:predicted amidophosphoribosyltransferase